MGLANISLFLFPMIFFSAKPHFARVYQIDSRCKILAEQIPLRIDCPSFDYIFKNRMDEGIGFFCRFLMYKICFHNFSRDRLDQALWKELFCTRPIKNFNTVSGLGLNLRIKNIKLFDKYCIGYGMRHELWGARDFI